MVSGRVVATMSFLSLPSTSYVDVIELAVALAELDFDVGDGGAAVRTPVHHRQVAIDQAVLVQLHEDVAHGAGETFVEREALARPVAGSAEARELVFDLGGVLFLPLPHALDELLAANVEARDPFLRELRSTMSCVAIPA
jgi:hypothetical protein